MKNKSYTMSKKNEYLKNSVTVIVRTIGERTTNLCIELLKKYLPANFNIIIVNKIPFTESIRESYNISIRENRKWTLIIDADVIVKNGAIEELLKFAETLPENVFEVEGKIIDKFLVNLNPRYAGNHLYRTTLLKKAIKLVPDSDNILRPEKHVKDKMCSLGYECVETDIYVGVHDFEQYYEDIYRKNFIQAKKHTSYGLAISEFWEREAIKDRDYIIALAGFNAGLQWDKDVSIDKKAHFMKDFPMILRKNKFAEKESNISNRGYLENYLSNYEKFKNFNGKKKIAVYTTVIREQDKLVNHKFISKEFDYICFTDKNITNPGVWQIKSIPKELEHSSNNTMKYLPHKILTDYDFSVWIDCNIDVLNDSFEQEVLNNVYNESNIALVYDYDARNLYNQIYLLQSKNNCCDTNILESLLKKMQELGIPKNRDGFKSEIIFRKHNSKQCIRLAKVWLEENKGYKFNWLSFKDCITLGICLWKEAMQPSEIYLENKFCLNTNSHYKKIYSHLQCKTKEGLLLHTLPYIWKSTYELIKLEYKLDEPAYVNSITFYPCNNYYCIISMKTVIAKLGDDIFEIFTEDIVEKNIETNGVFNKKGGVYFNHKNSEIFWNVNNNIDSLIIEFKLEIVSSSEVIMRKEFVIEQLKKLMDV